MTYALVGLCVLLAGMLSAAGLWLRSEVKEGKTCRDRLEEMDDLADRYHSERDVEVAAHAVTSAELAETKLRLASAEADRNEAWRLARDQIAEQILSSGIGDAVALGNRILSAPMPGVRLSETADGRLEKP